MENLGNPNKTLELIKSHDFSIQKKYGQNFLIDANVLSSIVSAAGITEDDIVLEIGPGLGALTEYLLQAAKHVIAVEVDKMLIPILKENFKDYENFTLINDDILKVDIGELIASVSGGSGAKVKVVANLPYYITTPIVMELLEKQHEIDSITVMIQKEVAVRMQEGPGSKAYGALSLAVQFYSRPEVVMIVSKNCFIPKPDVDSAVIKLDIFKEEERPVKAKDEGKMFDIIRAAFNQRRKTLVNALGNAQNLNWSKEQVAEALVKMGKSETIRGEALSLSDFAELSDILA
ncbi:MAG: 16S rRNA (adenine(1518)-N(6)/adenine(1519)-N(6))-dimethyltransferase RsmA [Lachnospiraceae bacterium]|nr:16S rRNA (adenine(1518)-N(6)/adenine(1519)-N(6))-dimethyltransferase RsmA [Lachnospiraceae bacterium]